MSAKPQPLSVKRASLFSDRGQKTAKLSLFQAVFYDRTQEAIEIIASDSEQINLQEPFAALTALHIAIFRQNILVIRDLCLNPTTKIGLQDRFGRKAIDMCVYTHNDEIFQLVSERTF